MIVKQLCLFSNPWDISDRKRTFWLYPDHLREKLLFDTFWPVITSNVFTRESRCCLINFYLVFPKRSWFIEKYRQIPETLKLPPSVLISNIHCLIKVLYAGLLAQNEQFHTSLRSSSTTALSSSVVRAPYRNHGAAGSTPAGGLMVVFSQLLPVWLWNCT